MARLRKPSPLEPTISLQPDQARPRRSSPRKAVREVSYAISSDEDEENAPLRPKVSTRDGSDPSSTFQDDTFYTSKTHASPSVGISTPRKQRTLRPIEGNSRLLRQPADQSFMSPEEAFGSERRSRRERSSLHKQNVDAGRKRNLIYARSLARSFAGKELKKASSKIDVLGDEGLQTPSKMMEEKDAREVVETREVFSEPEDETSVLCGDEANLIENDHEEHVEMDGGTNHASTGHQTTSETEGCDNDYEDEEDAVVPPVRSRQRRQQRCIESESDSDLEEEPAAEVMEEETQQEPKVKEPQDSQSLVLMRPPHRKGHSTISNWAQEVIDLTDSPEPPESFVLPEVTRVRTSSFAISRPETSPSNDAQPFLTYSPTPKKKRSPCKAPPLVRPVTPPLEPDSSTKLVSPSKKKPLIPRAPDLRPSLDTFWNPEVVNDWNDRHSPAKKLVSPRKQKWRDEVTKTLNGYASDSLSSSGEESASPISKSKNKTGRAQSKDKSCGGVAELSIKEARMQRKDFADRKNDIATSFLKELDATICSSSITKLSEATGGIKLIWSKTLKTTAGRANWRREVIRVKTSSNPPAYTSEVRHHCSIELASKVIDDVSRLYNVLAHEYCHLLTFMISEVRNNPHGAEFKAWGRKVSAAFADRRVEVTTKHSYAIEYKFVWECVSCGYEFKRHSRSVDPVRHSCGKCKGKLVQTKPIPRTGGTGKNGKGAKQGEYQAFVRLNFKKVKEEMALQGVDTQMGKVMEMVAKQYRERKKDQANSNEEAVDSIDDALKELKL